MPRKSASARAIAPVDNPLEVVRRLAPPRELSVAERGVFRHVVDAMPADWFSAGALGLLVQYCKHVVVAKALGVRVVAAMSAEDWNTFDGLLEQQRKETRVITTVATALRLTPQATTPRQVSIDRVKRAGSSPWVSRGGTA